MSEVSTKPDHTTMFSVSKPTPNGLVIRGDDLDAVVDIRKTERSYRDIMQRSVAAAVGYNYAREFENQYPMGVFVRGLDIIKEMYSNWFNPDECKNFAPVLKLAKELKTELEAVIDEGVKLGYIEYEDLSFLFKPGTRAAGTFGGELVAGPVVNVVRHKGMFSDYIQVNIRVIVDLSGQVAENVLGLIIGAYGGRRQVTSLPIFKPDEDHIETLRRRGELFRQYAGQDAYLSYQGQCTRSSWRTVKSYRADGRVMIDPKSFSQIDSDQFRLESYQNGLEEDEDDNKKEANVIAFKIEDEDLWRTYPFVWGFSFAAKQWGRFAVSGLSEIKWREDAFDQLVLEEDKKKLIRALVENSGGSFSDIIEGKGGGIIFLLHGPPGQGKTLTAEAIAELLKRPLYSVSIGELGTDPDALEERLRVVLDIATVWDAVVLMDEADIFLEARDERDIVRNAMVGVFLRLLEYHQGVLFLTTNRVKNIDKAFYSRISVALHFVDADSAKRQQIWTNLLAAAKIDTLDAAELASFDLNGRQIKNVIRLSQTLAKDEDVPINEHIVRRVVDLTTQFEKDLKG
jgi:hypothetical protein